MTEDCQAPCENVDYDISLSYAHLSVLNVKKLVFPSKMDTGKKMLEDKFHNANEVRLRVVRETWEKNVNLINGVIDILNQMYSFRRDVPFMFLHDDHGNNITEHMGSKANIPDVIAHGDIFKLDSGNAFTIWEARYANMSVLGSCFDTMELLVPNIDSFSNLFAHFDAYLEKVNMSDIQNCLQTNIPILNPLVEADWENGTGETVTDICLASSSIQLAENNNCRVILCPLLGLAQIVRNLLFEIIDQRGMQSNRNYGCWTDIKTYYSQTMEAYFNHTYAENLVHYHENEICVNLTDQFMPLVQLLNAILFSPVKYVTTFDISLMLSFFQIKLKEELFMALHEWTKSCHWFRNFKLPKYGDFQSSTGTNHQEGEKYYNDYLKNMAAATESLEYLRTRKLQAVKEAFQDMINWINTVGPLASEMAKNFLNGSITKLTYANTFGSMTEFRRIFLNVFHRVSAFEYIMYICSCQICCLFVSYQKNL